MKKILFSLVLAVAAVFSVQGADAVKVMTDDNAVEYITKASRPYVIDFSATWCGPCRMFAPTYDKVAKSMADKVDFYKVDIDRSPRIARTYNVRAVPTILIYNPENKKSRVVQGVVGEEDFVAAVDAVM